LDDERGLLLFEMIRFAKALEPQAILMEQVKGLLSAPDETGEPGGVFQ
jgi:DNA (cytosine-5)-methyltransferase 1